LDEPRRGKRAELLTETPAADWSDDTQQQVTRYGGCSRVDFGYDLDEEETSPLAGRSDAPRQFAVEA